MRSDDKLWTPAEEERLRRGVCTDRPLLRRMRHLNLLLPKDPRCRTCLRPFAGIGGSLLRLTGYGPSKLNPAVCNWCYERVPIGGTEAEIGILFVDIRGFTAMAEEASPEETAALLNRFYALSTDAIWHRDGLIDKLVGDEVMALFMINMAGEHAVKKMASSAEALVRGVGYGSEAGPWLPIGIGLDFGLAFVGNVGAGEAKDWTAVGDVVNTAARLQREAKPGQIVMSERVYRDVRERFPDALAVELSLKGKSEPVPARIVDLTRAGS